MVVEFVSFRPGVETAITRDREVVGGSDRDYNDVEMTRTQANISEGVCSYRKTTGRVRTFMMMIALNGENSGSRGTSFERTEPTFIQATSCIIVSKEAHHSLPFDQIPQHCEKSRQPLE